MAAEAPVEAPAPDQATMAPKSPFFDKLVSEVEGNMQPPEVAPELKEKAPPETPAKPPAKAEAPKDQKPPAQPTQPAQPPKDDDKVFTSPKAADWKKLKGERDDWQKKATEHETAVKAHAEKIAAIEKEYTEYKAKTSVKPEEIEETRKQNQELSAKLERHALSETPKFQAHYNGRFEAAVNQAVDAVGKDNADQIRAIMEAPKSKWRKDQLNTLVETMESQVDKLNLIGAVNEYDKARDERGRELDNHRANLKELKAREQQEQQQAAERQLSNRKVILAQTLKEAEKFEAFKTGDDAEHNLAVAKNRKLVEDFVMGGTIPDSVVLMLPVLAAEGERLQKVTATQAAKIKELEEAIGKYKTAQPSLEGDGAPKQEGEGGRIKGYVDEVMEKMGQIPGRQRER